MKIIHCADLHLDSKMNLLNDKDKAKQRKQELLLTFTRMVDYALENRVDAILICGDMFDTRIVSALTRNAVSDKIAKSSDIDFYYLKGNHDADSFIDSLEVIPENLHLFDNKWKSYSLDEEGKIMLWGVELDENNSGAVQNEFSPDPSKINLVMLHGQQSESGSKDKAEVINMKLFKNKGIRYMALGHVHKYQREELDGEGIFCYPGCLEGRGFDECGEHGFVLLDLDNESGLFTDTFIPFAFRKSYEIRVDISTANKTPEVMELVTDSLVKSKATKNDLIKLVLEGSVSIDNEFDLQFITNSFKDSYFFIKSADETVPYVNYEEFALDESLKGEFVRMVKALDISDEEKARVIMCGLNVLGGGKPEE